MGYFMHVEILNSKDFGIPQYRRRIFVIASLKQANLYLNSEHHLLNLDLFLCVNSESCFKDFIKEGDWLLKREHYQKNKKEKYYSKNGRVQIPFYSYVSENKVVLVSPDYEEVVVPTITARGAFSRQWLAFPASDYIKEKFPDFAIFIIDNKEWVIRRMVDWENWRLMNLGSDNYDKLKNSGFGWFAN